MSLTLLLSISNDGEILQRVAFFFISEESSGSPGNEILGEDLVEHHVIAFAREECVCHVMSG